MTVLACRLFSLSTSPVFSPNRPAMALTVSPRTIVYSAGAVGWAGLKAAGMVVDTEDAGMTADVPCAAWAFIAAASVAGTARAGCSAAAGWASAKDDKTTAGSAAVVAAITGRLGLGCRWDERDIVMERILFSTAGAGGDAAVILDTTVTQVIRVTSVNNVNLSRIADYHKNRGIPGTG